MARYIDAYKLLEEVKRGGHALQEWSTLGVCCVIERQPTADVVPKSEVIAVFDELESTLDLIGAMVGLDIRLYGSYAELKKKYVEEKK